MSKFAGGDQTTSFEAEGLLQSGWVVQMDEFGATEATSTYAIKRGKDSNINKPADDWAYDQIGETHYYADWLICEKASVNHQAGISFVTLNYYGVQRYVEATKVSIEASLIEEPIDSHHNFAEIAGKPSEMSDVLGYVPDKGSVFSGKDDLSDSFQKFVTTGANNNGRQTDSLVGVENYLRPEIVFVEERTLGDGLTSTATQELVDNLGERFTDVPDTMYSPTGSTENIPTYIPQTHTDADWLLISADYTPKGEGGILKRKWRLSGVYGWNELVYQKGKDSVGASSRNQQAYGQGSDAIETLNDERIKIAGDVQPLNEPPLRSSYFVDKENHATATYIYEVKAGDGVKLGKDYMTGAQLHVYRYLSAKQVTITGLQGGLESVEIKFKGVVDDGDWNASMNVNTIVEPIDAHPNFHEGGNSGDVIAGILGASKNGAKFNNKGAFQEFSAFVGEDNPDQAWWKTKLDSSLIIDGHMPNAMAKVESYVEAGVNWTEHKYFTDIGKAILEVKKIGYIKDPESTNPRPPRVKSKVRGSGFRNWLLVDSKFEMVSTDFESGYRVSNTYRLSGNRGWNESIYEEG